MSGDNCRLCGEPKPGYIDHIWACCSDGPGYGNTIKPEKLACVQRQLAKALTRAKAAEAEVAALEEENRQHCFNFQAVASALGILEELPDHARVVEECQRLRKEIAELKSELEFAWSDEADPLKKEHDEIKERLKDSMQANVGLAQSLEFATAQNLELSEECQRLRGQLEAAEKLTRVLCKRCMHPAHKHSDGCPEGESSWLRRLRWEQEAASSPIQPPPVPQVAEASAILEHVPIDASEKEQGRLLPRPEALCVPHRKPNCHDCWLAAYMWQPNSAPIGPSGMGQMEGLSKAPQVPAQGEREKLAGTPLTVETMVSVLRGFGYRQMAAGLERCSECGRLPGMASDRCGAMAKFPSVLEVSDCRRVANERLRARISALETLAHAAIELRSYKLTVPAEVFARFEAAVKGAGL